MARTTSTTARKIEAEVTLFDCLGLIIANRGAMPTEKALGELLYKNESVMIQAMKDAALQVIQPQLFKLAGILPMPITDEQKTMEVINESQTAQESANVASVAGVDKSAALPENTNTGKAHKANR